MDQQSHPPQPGVYPPEIVAQMRNEYQAIMEQVPSFQGMSATLKRAQDGLASPDMAPAEALHSAVGALVFCQLEQFKTVLKQLAARATMLEAALNQIDKGKPLVVPVGTMPDGMTGGRGRFGR